MLVLAWTQWLVGGDSGEIWGVCLGLGEECVVLVEMRRGASVDRAPQSGLSTVLLTGSRGGRALRGTMDWGQGTRASCDIRTRDDRAPGCCVGGSHILRSQPSGCLVSEQLTWLRGSSWLPSYSGGGARRPTQWCRGHVLWPAASPGPQVELLLF